MLDSLKSKRNDKVMLSRSCKLVVTLLVASIVSSTVSAFTPPVQTTPTFIIDDFEHWSSSSELQGWYQQRNPCTVTLDDQEKHGGRYSMKMVLPDAPWAGTTHWGDFTWDIGEYDSLIFWLKGDGSGCGILILFREEPVGCAEVFTSTVRMRSANAGQWIRVAWARRFFMTGYPENPCGSANGALDDKIQEFNIMLADACGYGGDHTIWIDDIAWVPKRDSPVHSMRPVSGADHAPKPEGISRLRVSGITGRPGQSHEASAYDLRGTKIRKQDSRTGAASGGIRLYIAGQ